MPTHQARDVIRNHWSKVGVVDIGPQKTQSISPFTPLGRLFDTDRRTALEASHYDRDARFLDLHGLPGEGQPSVTGCQQTAAEGNPEVSPSCWTGQL